MIEQVLYSVTVILVNLSLYLIAFTQFGFKSKVLLILSLLFMLISFSIRFENELFLKGENSFLIMFSCGIIGIRVLRAINLNPSMLKLDSKLRERGNSMFYLTALIMTVTITIFQLMMIWSPANLPTKF